MFSVDFQNCLNSVARNVVAFQELKVNHDQRRGSFTRAPSKKGRKGSVPDRINKEIEKRQLKIQSVTFPTYTFYAKKPRRFYWKTSNSPLGVREVVTFSLFPHVTFYVWAIFTVFFFLDIFSDAVIKNLIKFCFQRRLGEKHPEQTFATTRQNRRRFKSEYRQISSDSFETKPGPCLAQQR